MSSYKNNKDGTLTPIATNTHIENTDVEAFVTEGELNDGLSTKVDWVTQGKLGCKNLLVYPYSKGEILS